MDAARIAARIIGPALLALSATEGLNYDIFDGNSPAVVYLNGTLFLVAGLATLNARNHWDRSWRSLIPLCGWIFLALGLFRMVAPKAAQLPAGPAVYLVMVLLFELGATLSLLGYGRSTEGER